MAMRSVQSWIQQKQHRAVPGRSRAEEKVNKEICSIASGGGLWYEHQQQVGQRNEHVQTREWYRKTGPTTSITLTILVLNKKNVGQQSPLPRPPAP